MWIGIQIHVRWKWKNHPLVVFPYNFLILVISNVIWESTIVLELYGILIGYYTMGIPWEFLQMEFPLRTCIGFSLILYYLLCSMGIPHSMRILREIPYKSLECDENRNLNSIPITTLHTSRWSRICSHLMWSMTKMDLFLIIEFATPLTTFTQMHRTISCTMIE